MTRERNCGWCGCRSCRTEGDLFNKNVGKILKTGKRMDGGINMKICLSLISHFMHLISSCQRLSKHGIELLFAKNLIRRFFHSIIDYLLILQSGLFHFALNQTIMTKEEALKKPKHGAKSKNGLMML